MKQMKTRMTRIAAVLMSLMMLLSTLVLPAAAAPLLDDSVNNYGLTYADGIYTVSINAETLTELLQAETLDKQALLQCMPASLYNFLLTRDANSALDVLKELYAASDLGALKNDLPVHIVTDSFTKEDLLSVVNTDKVMEIIDIDALVASAGIENILKPGALDELIAKIDLTPLLSDTAKVEAVLASMTTDEILATLLPGAIETWLGNGVVNIGAIVDADLIDGVIEEGIVTTDELKSIIKNDATLVQKVIDENIVSVETLLANATIIDAVKSDASVIAALQADSADLAAALNLGYGDVKNYLTVANETALLEALVAAGKLTATSTIDDVTLEMVLPYVNQSALVNDLLSDGKIPASLLKDYVPVNVVMDIEGVADAVLAADADLVSKVMDKGLISDTTISALIDAEKVMEALDAGLVTTKEIFDNVTDMSTLLKYVELSKLPYDKVLAVFSTQELLDVVMADGVQELIPYIDFKAVLQLDAFKDALQGITKDDLLAAVDMNKIKNDLFPKALDAFLGYVINISLNGTTVYADHAFDMTAIEYAVADAIPTPADIANVGADGVVASFVLSYVVYNTATGTFDTYTNGFQVALVGDTTALATYAAKIDAMAQMKVSYLGTDSLGYSFVIVAPEKLAELYITSLTSEKLSVELREKLFGIGNVTVEQADAEAAVDALLNKLTLDEVRKVLNAVELGGYNQVILDKLDLYESQAETIRQKLVAALDRFLTAVVDSNVADTVYGKTLADFYQGEGRFLLDVAFTLTIPVPEIAEGFVVNNTIQHNVTVDATATSLYQVQFVDGETVLYTAYRTEGCALDELFALPEMKLDGVSQWMDADKNIVDPATLTMPAADLVLMPVRSFTATFVVEGEVVGTDEFDPADLSTLEFPDTADRQHYTLVWDDFTLDYADITITGSYVPTMYTVTYMNGDALWAIRSFSFETYPGMMIPALPAAPIGYVASWSLPFIPLENAVIHAVYTPVVYYVTFVDADGNEIAKVPFTVENAEIAYPEVPEKDGAIGTWPELTADVLLDTDYYNENGFSFDREVAPIYEANTYYVTFVDKDGNTVAKVPFTAGDKTLPADKIPAVPAVKGYTAGKWAAYTLGAADITVAPVYELETYYITFVGMDGKTVQKVAFTIESSSINAPAVPAVKGYKAGAWNTYKLLDETVYSKTGSYNQTVEAKYELETYYITFVDKDGKQIGKVEFNIKTSSIKAPAVPTLEGYTVAWPSYKLLDEDVYSKTGSYNQTVKAVYTAVGEEKTYTATFVADGKEVAKVTFKATDSKLSEPTVPAKDGYTAAWEKYTLGAADITINAVYTVIEYTVTFVADGTTVGTAKYTVENKSITEPAVPEKEGYTGKWESYTLTTGDVTVNAVYTAEGEVEPPVEEPSNLLWLWILIAVVAAGGIAVAVVFIIKKKATPAA